jgi:uncharacterized protein (TIGR02646 family)
MRKVTKPGHPPPDGLYTSDEAAELIPVREASARMLAVLDAWEVQHGAPMEAKAVRSRFFERLDKQRVREILRAEQHGRCAFCEGLVTERAPASDDRRSTGMRIAHWTPIEVDRRKTLTWSNLFGSCQRQGSDAHCDVFQESHAPPGDAPTPAEQDYGRWMRLSADGALRPGEALTPAEEAWVEALIALFNLNAERLKSARLAAIDGLQQRLDRSRAEGRRREYKLDDLDIELARLRGECPDVPYPTAQRLWLERRRARV